jgi:YD repeat-containing protein
VSRPDVLPDGTRLWVLPENVGTVDVSIQADLSNLTSGVYRYTVEGGVSGIRAVTNHDNTVSVTSIGSSSINQNRLVIVNDNNSVFGSGWNVSGLEKLIITNDDNSVLLINGDGSQHLYDAPVTTIPPSTLAQTYISLPGDYSTLQRLADGTFKRTTKDGTVYQFNSQGLMVAATDREGNTTQHLYNTLGQIQQIVDPVGLTTTFNYTGNRVTSIIDPAGRTTTLTYDGQGNLISVTDPDATQNRYGYDSNHLVTSSTDKTGEVKIGTYDQFGRAQTATREDGSIVQINPVEVQGLRDTTYFYGLPIAQRRSITPTSTYVDGNGNTITNQVDNQGHLNTSTDAIGTQKTNTRDSAGNVITTNSATGQVISYTYDSKGNVSQAYETVDVALKVNQIAQTIPVTSGAVSATVTGDINGDGIADLVSAIDNGRLEIRWGDANNPLSSSSIVSTLPFTESILIDRLELRDVNGDGKLDLLANLPIDGQTGGGDGENLTAQLSFQTTAAASTIPDIDPVLVFLNQGAGTFSAPEALTLDAKSAGFVSGDFNGDGKLDILAYYDVISARVNSITNPLVLFAGNGSGNFTRTSITLPGIDTDNVNFSGNFSIKTINIAGKTDLVFNLPNQLNIFERDNSGSWNSTYVNNNVNEALIAVGDLNSDGH